MKQTTIKISALCLCIAIAGIIINTDSEVRAQGTGCFRVSLDSSVFGPVFYGAQVTRTMAITNIENSSKTINNLTFTGGDNSEFSISDCQFPLMLSANDTRQITLVFSPLAPKSDGTDNFSTKLILQSRDLPAGSSLGYDIYGAAIRPTGFNTINPFDPTSILPTLKMSDTGAIFGQTFLFQSTDTASLKVTDVNLENNEDVHFTFKAMLCCGREFPVVFIPGDMMAVRVTFQSNDSKLYRNQLRFNLDNSAVPITYNIEAMRIEPQAGVTSETGSPEIFTFSTMPNPSSGNIAIEIAGANKADVEIFDATGKIIISQNNVSSWSWNGQTTSGTPVSAGNYFIRATTHDASGKVMASMKQVAIVR